MIPRRATSTRKQAQSFLDDNGNTTLGGATVVDDGPGSPTGIDIVNGFPTLPMMNAP